MVQDDLLTLAAEVRKILRDEDLQNEGEQRT